MTRTKFLFFNINIALFLLISCGSSENVDPNANIVPGEFSGPYLGQTPPESGAARFAPSQINTGLHMRDIAMTPDGKEFYFSTNTTNHSYSTIYVIKEVNNFWTKAEIAPFATQAEHRYGEPFISPDGNKMYFISTQPMDATDESSDYNIWVMDREGDSWGTPRPMESPINTSLNEFFPSLTNDGTIYFTRTIPLGTFIFRSRLVNGVYEEPVKLGAEVNPTNDQYNAFIAPDESYLIVPISRHIDSHGGTDYYICFRNADDSWHEPINLGEPVNSIYSREWSAYVSPDKKYLFFMSNRLGLSNIFWTDAGFIEDLRPS